MSHDKRHWLANVMLLTITFVWGATFTLTKGALVDVQVYPFLFIRFLVATIVLVLISVASPQTRRGFTKRTWTVGSALGIVLFAAYAFQTLGLSQTSPSVAGFLTGLNVILVPIFSIPFFRRIPHLRTWSGAVVAVIGLALISGSDLMKLQAGDIEVIVCAAFIALQILLIEKYGADLDSLALATVELLVVCLASLFMSMQGGNLDINLHIWLKPAVFWAILINAVLGSSFAYWGQNVFQRQTTATQIAIIFSMEPVFAAIIAWVALHDGLSPLEMAGGILIFASMLVADPTVKFARPWKRSTTQD